MWLVALALSADFPLLAEVGFGVLGLVLLGLTVRIIRSGIVVTEAGLEVRGFVRTTRVRWAEVTGFPRPSASGVNSSVYIAVKVADGRVLKSSGLVAPRNGQFGDRVTRELESLRQAKVLDDVS